MYKQNVLDKFPQSIDLLKEYSLSQIKKILEYYKNNNCR